MKTPLSAQELSQLPVEMQRRAKYDQYKYVKDRMDESQEAMLNYNEKIPMKVRYKMYWENRPNGPKFQNHKKDCGSFRFCTVKTETFCVIYKLKIRTPLIDNKLLCFNLFFFQIKYLSEACFIYILIFTEKIVLPIIIKVGF